MSPKTEYDFQKLIFNEYFFLIKNDFYYLKRLKIK
jgi:hypothetical protein